MKNKDFAAKNDRLHRLGEVSGTAENGETLPVWPMAKSWQGVAEAKWPPAVTFDVNSTILQWPFS